MEKTNFQLGNIFNADRDNGGNGIHIDELIKIIENTCQP